MRRLNLRKGLVFIPKVYIEECFGDYPLSEGEILSLPGRVMHITGNTASVYVNHAEALALVNVDALEVDNPTVNTEVYVEGSVVEVNPDGMWVKTKREKA